MSNGQITLELIYDEIISLKKRFSELEDFLVPFPKDEYIRKILEIDAKEKSIPYTMEKFNKEFLE
jgi:hypothetical protein